MNLINHEKKVKFLAKKYDYLPYMIDRYINFFGMEETKLLLEATQQKTKPTIRINTIKVSVEDLIKRLKEKEIILKSIEEIPYGFEVIKSKYNLGSTHEFLQGYYYLQNKASMLPALILKPKSDEIVMDMCAAPGSKASQLAQEMNNKGVLILIERNAKRIPKLEYNLRRLGISNSIIINMDARNIGKLDLKADKILLDAPCTGEGLIRNDPRRKKSRKMSDIKKMASIQADLLKSGLDNLKKGGKLLYSTCSLAPEENEFIVNQVLQKLKGYSILKIESKYGISGFTNVLNQDLLNDLNLSKRLLPHKDGSIGFFMCLIQRE